MEEVFMIEGQDLNIVRRSIRECLKKITGTSNAASSQDNSLAMEDEANLETNSETSKVKTMKQSESGAVEFLTNGVENAESSQENSLTLDDGTEVKMLPSRKVMFQPLH